MFYAVIVVVQDVWEHRDGYAGIVRGGQGRLPEGGDFQQGLREQVAVKKGIPSLAKGAVQRKPAQVRATVSGSALLTPLSWPWNFL